MGAFQNVDFFYRLTPLNPLSFCGEGKAMRHPIAIGFEMHPSLSE